MNKLDRMRNGLLSLATALALGFGASQALAEPPAAESAARTCTSSGCSIECGEAGCLGRCVSGGCYCMCN